MPQKFRLSKRWFIMAVGFTLLSILVLFGVFSTVYSGAIKRDYYVNGKSDKDLQLVHLVFRHGPRTPADTYPTDPYLNEAFFPFGWGQLTNDGKTELFEAGQWIRERYDDFLGSLYEPDILHAQATGVSRTHMSSALVLAGLWPPRDTLGEWNKQLNWQPIPIYSESLDNDSLLLVRTPCPRYYEALASVFEEPEVRSVLLKNKPMCKELTRITGLNITTPDDVQSLYSTLRAEAEFGLTLPSWTKDYYPDQLKYMTEMSYIYNVYNDELKKIKGGPFVKKMLEEWQKKSTNTLKPTARKLFIYTGHDSTVVNILSSLNIWERQIPVYGIMAIFELYKNNTSGEHSIQIYLKNETSKEPYPLTLPGCEFDCPLDKIKILTKPIVPQDIAAECTAFDVNFTEPPLGGP